VIKDNYFSDKSMSVTAVDRIQKIEFSQHKEAYLNFWLLEFVQIY